MPIRPENRARYPDDWPAISLAVKERAGWRCEGSPDFPDCQVRHGELGGRNRAGVWYAAQPVGERLLRLEWPKPGTLWWCDDHPDKLRIVRIVLTVGHLDHTPENCDPSNLRAWCQRCHLHYDRDHHAETAYRTRREGRAIGDLLEPQA